MAELDELDGLDNVIEIRLGPKDDRARALRIIRAAVLEINDVVAELYEGAVMPARVSELERKNYGA